MTIEASAERKGTFGAKGTIGAGLVKVSAGAWVEVSNNFEVDWAPQDHDEVNRTMGGKGWNSRMQ